MKTLVIRQGARLTIRAVATAADAGGRDRCRTLSYFQEQARLRPGEMEKLAVLLTETAESGPPKNENKFKDLEGTDGLYEFKTSGGLRVFCFWDEGSLIVCTHGYLKGAQKAPKREVQQAEKLKRDYFHAKQRGELTHGQPRRQGV
jgi:phage-related protein